MYAAERLVLLAPAPAAAGMRVRLFPELAKQAVEKIDRLRNCAGVVLQRMLHSSPAGPEGGIPCIELLLGAVPSKDTIVDWSAPEQSFPKLFPLLGAEAYSYPLLCGLVTCAGGLTEYLFKLGRKHLLEAIEDAAAFQALLLNVLRLLKEFHKDSRLCVPALKTLTFLMESGCFLKASGEFAAALTELVRAEIRGGPNDIAKVLACVPVLSECATFAGAARESAFSGLFALLCHRFPRVRLLVAETVFSRLSASSKQLGLAQDVADEACELVTVTIWDGAASVTKPARNQLVELLKLCPPIKVAPKKPKPAAAAAAAKEATPELPLAKGEVRMQSRSAAEAAAAYASKAARPAAAAEDEPAADGESSDDEI